MNHSTVQMIKVRCWTQMKVGIVLQQTKASIIAVKVTVRWFLPCAWKDKSNPASHHSSPLSSAIPSASLADMRKIQCANQRITSQQEFVIESLKCLSAKNFINKQSAGSVWEYHPSKDGRMLHVRRGKQTLCSLRGVQWVCWWGHIYECVFVCWIRYEGVMDERVQTGSCDFSSPAATRSLDLPLNSDQTHILPCGNQIDTTAVLVHPQAQTHPRKHKKGGFDVQRCVCSCYFRGGEGRGIQRRKSHV